MPTVSSRANEFKHKFYNYAPKRNQEKIEKVVQMYKDKANMNFKVGHGPLLSQPAGAGEG